MNIRVEGAGQLMKQLNQINDVRVDEIITDNTTQIFNRAAGTNPSDGGTPVDTGWMRVHRGVFGSGREMGFGYLPEYAPHVEYGHRTVNGGYIPGQHFLQKNVDIQSKILKSDIDNEIRRYTNA